jgi:hypothetical protein
MPMPYARHVKSVIALTLLVATCENRGVFLPGGCCGSVR